jgi:hypothetical protein
MDDAESARLRDLRARIYAGEELPPQLFALYQDLVALEARASAGNIIPSHMYLNIPLLFNELTPLLLLYIYFLTLPPPLQVCGISFVISLYCY